MTQNGLTKILYAEDEDDIRSIAQIALEDIGGFQVKYCRNGQEVLDSIKDFKPDLVLLDVMMPEMDGPTTLVRLRQLSDYKSVPIIFMTAKIQPNEIASYKSLGVLEVITKPFDPLTLSEELNKVWEKTKKSNPELL